MKKVKYQHGNIHENSNVFQRPRGRCFAPCMKFFWLKFRGRPRHLTLYPRWSAGSASASVAPTPPTLLTACWIGPAIQPTKAVKTAMGFSPAGGNAAGGATSGAAGAPAAAAAPGPPPPACMPCKAPAGRVPPPQLVQPSELGLGLLSCLNRLQLGRDPVATRLACHAAARSCLHVARARALWLSTYKTNSVDSCTLANVPASNTSERDDSSSVERSSR
jgi:hypothetical protein